MLPVNTPPMRKARKVSSLHFQPTCSRRSRADRMTINQSPHGPRNSSRRLSPRRRIKYMKTIGIRRRQRWKAPFEVRIFTIESIPRGEVRP
jgi:hypothetical protein